MDNTENQSTLDRIKQQIEENPILLYMKGSPKLPSCGFSSQASQALMSVSYTHLTLPTKRIV